MSTTRSFINKLPDKGVRIQNLHDKIGAELKSRDEIECAAGLFSQLNLVEKGQKALTHMEWNGGKLNGDQIIVAADTLDSDDDEIDSVDPLKIIAQSRNTKLVKVQKPAKSLITEADLADIKSMADEADEKKVVDTSSNSSSVTSSGRLLDLDQHAINIIQNEDCHSKDNAELKKHRFLPFRTTKTDVHNADKERCRSSGKNWENTAATPPLIRNDAVKMISLKESIETERDQQEKLREQMQKQAMERLEARRQIIADNITLLPAGSELIDPNSFFQSYRQREEKDSEDDDDLSSEHSALDEEEDYDLDGHGFSVVYKGDV